jgi:hypothetical protein
MNKGNYNYPLSSPSHRPNTSTSPRKNIQPYHGLQRRNSASSIYSQATDISSKSISSILTKNKKNDFLEFLIILCDDDYKGTFFNKSIYENLLKQRKYFNDNLNLVNKKDIKKNNDYLIDGMANIQKLYIKLPKENLYIDSSQFHNRYLNSKINELISVFSVLKAKTIKVTIESQTENNFKFNLSAGVKLNGVSLKTGAEKTKDTNNKLQSHWELEFFQNDNGNTNANTNTTNNSNTKININEFADNKKFYYLPKEAEWIDAIRKRVSQNASSDKFTYSYSDTNDIKYKGFTNLKLFNISCDYNKKQYENININYVIEYYPLDTIVIENDYNDKDNNKNVIIINNNNKNEKENMNILDYVNGFFSNIF